VKAETDRKRRRLYRINLSLTTHAEPTPHVVEVAAMFGIGVDRAQRLCLYRDLRLRIGPGDVVYITGQSGSGKSLLVAKLKQAMPDHLDLADVSVPADRPVIDCFDGLDVAAACKYLSLAGLAEAFVFIRKPAELSDGQRYRFRLARALAAHAGTIVIDEFCATLDRTTAKVVAYNVRKTADRYGVTFVVATTHTDLYDDLQPDVYVEKLFGPRARARHGRRSRLAAHG